MSARSDEPVGPIAQLIPQEREQFAAMVERVRQLRRRRGVPDGMSAEDAIAARIISAEEMERARWGDDAQPTSLARDETRTLGDTGHDNQAHLSG